MSYQALLQALISLGDLYNRAAARGTPAPNEAEFRSYMLLTMIGTYGRFGYNTATFMHMLSARSPPCS